MKLNWSCAREGSGIAPWKDGSAAVELPASFAVATAILPSNLALALLNDVPLNLLQNQPLGPGMGANFFL